VVPQTQVSHLALTCMACAVVTVAVVDLVAEQGMVLLAPAHPALPDIYRLPVLIASATRGQESAATLGSEAQGAAAEMQDEAETAVPLTLLALQGLMTHICASLLALLRYSNQVATQEAPPGRVNKVARAGRVEEDTNAPAVTGAAVAIPAQMRLRSTLGPEVRHLGDSGDCSPTLPETTQIFSDLVNSRMRRCSSRCGLTPRSS